MARIFSNYDYITNSQRDTILESNLPRKISIIQDNLLDFQINFNSFDFFYSELNKIAQELVSMGRYFATQQSLHETGNLINGIKAEVTGDYSVKFYNDARNSRNQFYAGHHEYGYRGRDGKFIEARPFMRPALYAVSRASQGEFATILEELLKGVFKEDGYQGIKNLNFGKQLGHLRYNSNQNTTLTNMMKVSTINPRHFNTVEGFESKTRNPWSVKRTVFSNKKNERHKGDLGWRSIKGSVRSGRNINRSTLASLRYARGIPKSKVTVIEKSPSSISTNNNINNGKKNSRKKSTQQNVDTHLERMKQERAQYNIEHFGNENGRQEVVINQNKASSIKVLQKKSVHNRGRKNNSDKVGGGRKKFDSKTGEGKKIGSKKIYSKEDILNSKITETRKVNAINKWNRKAKKRNEELGYTAINLIQSKRYKTGTKIKNVKKTLPRREEKVLENKRVRIYPVNPETIPKEKKPQFFKNFVEYTMTSEDLKLQGYHHYKDNMYWR